MSADATLFGVPMSLLGLLATGYYFAFFVVILPILSKVEKGKELPKSIHEAVLAEDERKAEKKKQTKDASLAPEAAE